MNQHCSRFHVLTEKFMRIRVSWGESL